VTLHRSAGDARIVVRGEIDLATAPALNAALEDAEAGDALRIVLDLSVVSFIDSAGIAALMRADARSRRDGGRLRLATSPAVDRVIDLCGLRGKLAFE
jgi:anti-anti-sigma factor